MEHRRRIKKGKGIMDVLGKVAGVLKNSGIIGHSLNAMGHPRAAGIVKSVGLGKRHKRVKRGGGLFNMLGGLLDHVTGMGKRKKSGTGRKRKIIVM